MSYSEQATQVERPEKAAYAPHGSFDPSVSSRGIQERHFQTQPCMETRDPPTVSDNRVQPSKHTAYASFAGYPPSSGTNATGFAYLHQPHSSRYTSLQRSSRAPPSGDDTRPEHGKAGRPSEPQELDDGSEEVHDGDQAERTTRYGADETAREMRRRREWQREQYMTTGEVYASLGASLPDPWDTREGVAEEEFPLPPGQMSIFDKQYQQRRNQNQQSEAELHAAALRRFADGSNTQ